ncbi:hypothetical protein DP939_08620 [Spongiactinospora rosea]|uniref:Ig-like domain-containing protein n=1 Tax=Spongiactinospora rosea TaxID=2248750 RepID=A0A366M5W0_9ACTN|nr:hypothetical protein [Spongiactinospora rosea]RBQ21100.1 hypothetical protein DP939_08620 [Spongiactinospora rosea]
MRSLRTLALPLALAAGLSLFQAPPAASATLGLTLTGGYCEPLARRFLCSVSSSGGVAPLATRWYVNGYHVPSYDNRSYAGIGCQPTFVYDIRAVISDAAGASVEYHTSPTCRSGNP